MPLDHALIERLRWRTIPTVRCEFTEAVYRGAPAPDAHLVYVAKAMRTSWHRSVRRLEGCLIRGELRRKDEPGAPPRQVSACSGEFEAR